MSEEKTDSTQGRLHWPRLFEDLREIGTAIAARCGPGGQHARRAASRTSLQAASMDKLCMQADLRSRGRTEVATGQAPECRKRKPGKVRISLASRSQPKACRQMQLRLLASCANRRNLNDHGRFTLPPRSRAAASGKPVVCVRVILLRK